MAVLFTLVATLVYPSRATFSRYSKSIFHGLDNRVLSYPSVESCKDWPHTGHYSFNAIERIA